MAKKKINVGMVGYGFMGRTHSNAFSQVGHFFDLPYQPVLKSICARSADKATQMEAQYFSRALVSAQELPADMGRDRVVEALSEY